MSSSSLLVIEALAFDHAGPFDLTLKSGQCVGLSGPSGSGKTRFLRCVADLDVHEGRLWLDGTPSEAIPPPEWRRRVALLPAESAWWHDAVRPHFRAAPTAGSLEALGFDERVLSWRIDRLSSGEKQRLAVLRLLAVEPYVLLLDEPTANLDQDNVTRVEDLIESYRREQGAAAIWVSHDPHQLQRVAGRRLRIEDGRFARGEAAA